MQNPNTERSRHFRNRLRKAGGKQMVITISPEQLLAINELFELKGDTEERSKIKSVIDAALNRVVEIVSNTKKLSDLSGKPDGELLALYKDIELKNTEAMPIDEFLAIVEKITQASSTIN